MLYRLLSTAVRAEAALEPPARRVGRRGPALLDDGVVQVDRRYLVRGQDGSV